ncbi:hypothetical protein MHBO_002074 [Bonamia ostreae]|uniref:Uncharacterized protein n=1 Tax=Bonamia ostreae TaxID=126728 RepID=A0ABV2AL64_9EUKA
MHLHNILMEFIINFEMTHLISVSGQDTYFFDKEVDVVADITKTSFSPLNKSNENKAFSNLEKKAIFKTNSEKTAQDLTSIGFRPAKEIMVFGMSSMLLRDAQFFHPDAPKVTIIVNKTRKKDGLGVLAVLWAVKTIIDVNFDISDFGEESDVDKLVFNSEEIISEDESVKRMYT